MGLGKSLPTLALIVGSMSHVGPLQVDELAHPTQKQIGGTLIVTPLSSKSKCECTSVFKKITI